MAERYLQDKKPEDMSICILRPSIIAAAEKEPMPGWTDTLSAAGGLSVAGVSGLLKYVNSKSENISDIIPVDYVCNSVIVSTAMSAASSSLTVVHCNSSHVNPITWGDYLNYGFQYIQYQPFSKQVFKPGVQFINDKQ
jgi:fatty acyl-CoA reductase